VKNFWLPLAGATLALTLLAQPSVVMAQGQQNPGWFVPNQPHPAAHPVARPVGTPAPTETAPAEEGPMQGPQIQVKLPPAPVIPSIPKGPPTPAAIIGVVSIPDALRVSTAYQEADKVFNDRHKKLDEDAQKEQVELRDLGQQLATERAKLSPEQIRQKERQLQDRIAQSRKVFGDRQRVIQEAGQYVMMQINRTLEQVVQQVAVSRGINVVLNRAQVLGTTEDFDLTPQVVEVLNKVLPQVVIPPDGVSPLNMTVPKEEPHAAVADEAPKAATPAKAKTPVKR
jgi:Skp family chaperone for outer membrane proteins